MACLLNHTPCRKAGHAREARRAAAMGGEPSTGWKAGSNHKRQHLSIAGFGGLIFAFFGEADAEEAEHVTVSSLHVDVSLDEGLPLPHQRANFVRGEGHAPEVG